MFFILKNTRTAGILAHAGVRLRTHLVCIDRFPVGFGFPCFFFFRGFFHITLALDRDHHGITDLTDTSTTAVDHLVDHLVPRLPL